MDIYKVSFIFLGIIYLALFFFGLSIPSRGVMGISAAGVLLCVLGWYFAHRML